MILTLFDAGSIEAKLTVNLSEFSRDMDKAEARVRKFEREGHHIRLDASFDESSIGKARRIFATLDNAISRDAMNRLRSSPQGSVLGTLNALFSPHPVTGAPSPQQSSSGGLLGRMISSPSGGTPEGGTLGGSGNGNANGDQTNLIRDVLTSNQQTTDLVKQQLEGAGPKDVTTQDDIRQLLTGTGAKNAETTDTIDQKLAGDTPGNVTTIDKIKQVVEGGAANLSDMSTTDTVRERLDKKSTDDVEKAAEDSGGRSGGRWTAGFGTHLGPFFLSFHKRLGDAGEDGGKQLGGGLLSGIGPGILGIGMKMSLMIGAIGSALAVLPALAGIIGVGMGVALIGGLLVEAVKGSKQLSAQFSALGGDFKTVLSNAIAPIVPLVSSAIKSLVPIIKSMQGPLTSIFKEIGPQIKGIFAGVGPIITGLLNIMKAAAPAFGPFILAIESLVRNLLPGIATVVKATTPFIKGFADILANLGASLGGLFADAAPAIGASMKILNGLLGLVEALLPVIMKLADIFAVTLAPVFTAFAGVVQTLLKPLTLVGSVIAAFAGAVIGDLASAFGAVAALIQAIGPSLGVFAQALSQVFNVLENTGVFAEIGDALEDLAPLLGQMIGLLITQLVPILPPLIGLLTTMGTIIIDLVAAGLGTLISWVNKILIDFPALVPILGMITGAWLAWNLVMDANPMGLIVLAVVAVIGAITLLATHWTQIWGEIEKVAKDAGDYIKGIWGDVEAEAKKIWGDISTFFTTWWANEVAIVTKNLDTVRNALATAWTDVANTLKAAWNAIAAFFTGWWDGEVNTFRTMVTMIKNALATAWDEVFATVKDAWGNIIAYFEGIPGRAVAALKALGPDLLFVGEWAIDQLLAGAKSGAATMVSWLEGFAKDVVNVFKTIWGWFSPSTVMYAGGKSLMDGLAAGVKDHAHKALAQVQSVAGKVTAGVAQWTGLVQQALKMEGLPLSLTHNVLYQMQTESGGNAAAINLTDSNAKAGDPSRGLMQVIGSTFAEYHWPGTSDNIYDPLANIAAALNYARNLYGPTLMRNGMGIGSGHGYAMGGLIPEPVLGWGVNSGDRYTFAEHAPEWVTPGAQPPGNPGVTAMLAKLDALITATNRIPAGVGDSVGGAIGGASMAASFRSRYPRGGA